jgi:glycosyltransferase involved in cell wall biosynthesis
MKTVAAIQAWNNFEFERVECLRRTHASLQNQCEVLLFDNASRDGTHELVKQMGGRSLEGTNGTWGAAMDLKVQEALLLGADIVIASDDDIEWFPGAVRRLEDFWRHAPQDLVLISGMMEPVWPWNSVLGVLDAGEERALIRTSAPGGGWSFRASHWPIIQPLLKHVQECDYRTCEALLAQGYRVGQLHLTNNLGVGKTTWDNNPEKGKALNWKKFGIDPTTGKRVVGPENKFKIRTSPWPWQKPKKIIRTVEHHDLMLVGDYSEGTHGLALTGRLAARAFESLGIKTHLVDAADPNLEAKNYSTSACILYDNPPVDPYVQRVGDIDGPIYGVWHWELPEAPSEWLNVPKYLTEVWCSSPFTKSIFEATEKPTRVVLHPMRAEDYRDVAKVPHSSDAFHAITVFDARSSYQRKNPFSAVQAFGLAFGDDVTAKLTVKMQHSEYDVTYFEELKREASKYSNIRILDQVLSYAEVMSLIRSSDVLISLHRSEGFGHTLAEAMMLGTPVVATRYSGNLAFMDDTNSLLVPYTLVPVRDRHPSFAGQGHQLWAEPDVEYAAAQLVRLRQDAELRSSLIENAHTDIVNKLSPATWLKTLPSNIRKLIR